MFCKTDDEDQCAVEQMSVCLCVCVFVTPQARKVAAADDDMTTIFNCLSESFLFLSLSLFLTVGREQKTHTQLELNTNNSMFECWKKVMRLETTSLRASCCARRSAHRTPGFSPSFLLIFSLSL